MLRSQHLFSPSPHIRSISRSLSAVARPTSLILNTPATSPQFSLARTVNPDRNRTFTSTSIRLANLESTDKNQLESNMVTFYDLKADMPGGKTMNFEDLKGKVVLIVNTASQCGFTPQYKGLQGLWDKYKDKDFVLLGFPCNQFGGQEPGDDNAISEFCTLNHGVTFPLMKKTDVNGDDTNEVYKWLKSEKAGILGLSRIKWNFEKFLVDKNGNVVHRWASTTTPDAIDAEIAKLL